MHSPFQDDTDYGDRKETLASDIVVHLRSYGRDPETDWKEDAVPDETLDADIDNLHRCVQAADLQQDDDDHDQDTKRLLRAVVFGALAIACLGLGAFILSR